jgi:hypothetical protein
MASFARRRLWAGLAVVMLCAGCNLMALPFFLIPGMEPKHDAKCKLTVPENAKEARVVILASCSAVETRAEFLRVDRELSQLLARHLETGFKENKEKIKVVPSSQVERYKDEHPSWQSLTPQELGKYFKSDYVIDLEINSISLYEEGSSNLMYRGHASVNIEVNDVHKGKEGKIYKEVYTIEFPRGYPLPADSSTSAPQFRQNFLDRMAKELSWRFTSHLVDDDFQCND